MEDLRLSPRDGDDLVSHGAERGSYWFVWTVWAIAAIGAFLFVHSFGGKAPFMDEWSYVDILSGHRQITFTWLWEQNNEHRIPLPRLVYLGLAWLSRSDFRAGMYFNVFALAGIAALALVVLRRQRGFAIAGDAFVPIALLHPGNYENLLFSFQVEFVISTAAVCGLLLLVARSHRPLTWKAVLALGVCLVSLPLCGAHGLPFVPPLAGWALLWAWRDRTAMSRGYAKFWTVSALAALSLLLVLVYFVGYQSINSHGGNHTWRLARETSWQFLTMSFGTVIMGLWDYARYLPWILGAANVAVLITAWVRRGDRVCLTGFVCFLVGMTGLALGIGWGRGAMGPNLGFAPRYTVLAVPALLASYLIWETFAPIAWGRFLQLSLFSVCAILCYGNTEIGIRAAQERREQFRALERDLYARLPPDQVAERNSFLYPQRDYLVQRLEWLRAAGIGQFRQMRPLGSDRTGPTN